MKMKIALTQKLILIFFVCVCSIEVSGQQMSDTVKTELFNSPLLFSIRTPKDEAKLFRDNYSLHPVLGKYNNNDILYFSFSASKIQEILKMNASGEKSPDQIVISIGKDNTGRWHAMAYGMNDTQLLNYSTAGYSNASIFDGAINESPINTTPLTEPQADGWHKSYTGYQSSVINCPKCFTTYDKCNMPILLEGFSFAAWQIQEILTNNAYGQQPDKVVFYLGFEPTTISTNRWHMIAYGKLGNSLLETSNTKNAAQTMARNPSIFDKADPCPPCHP